MTWSMLLQPDQRGLPIAMNEPGARGPGAGRARGGGGGLEAADLEVFGVLDGVAEEDGFGFAGF